MCVFQDFIAWNRWFLYYRCELHNLYNSTTCTELYGILPSCLSALEYATEISPSVDSRTAALKVCRPLENGDLHGTVAEDIRRNCERDNEKDSIHCSIPEIDWFNDFFADPEVKKGLGIPKGVNFSTFTEQVADEFEAYGDMFVFRFIVLPSLRLTFLIDMAVLLERIACMSRC